MSETGWRRRLLPLLTVAVVGTVVLPMQAVSAATPGDPATTVSQPTRVRPLPPVAVPAPTTAIEKGSASGYLPGAWDVGSDGAFTYAMPVDVPAGRAGVQPHLSLNYSSHGEDGSLGAGWRLSGIPTITRCPRSSDLDGPATSTAALPDRFCLDGQRLMAVPGSGSYGAAGTKYRTLEDTFAEITSLGGDSGGPEKFVVRGRSGLVQEFRAVLAHSGHSAVAQTGAGLSQADIDGTWSRMLWQLTSEQDRSGNRSDYTYAPVESPAQFLPTRIDYTAHGTDQAARRHVDFVYEQRPDTDPVLRYGSGVTYKITQRLAAIEAYAPNPAATSLVWSYHLGYGTDFLGKSLLTSVSKCGALGGCLRTRTFGWAGASTAPTFAVKTPPGTPAAEPVATTGPVRSAMRVYDADGDGLDDALYTTGGTTTGAQYYLRLGHRDTTGPQLLTTRRQLNGFGDWPVHADVASARPVDIDSDGVPELWLTHDGGFEPRLYRWNAGRKVYNTSTVLLDDLSDVNFADFNGDGRPDAIGLYAAAGGARRFGIRLNTGTGFAPLVQSTVAGSDSPKSGPCLNHIADVDGDGRADLMLRAAVGGKCATDVQVVSLTPAGIVQATVGTASLYGAIYHYFGTSMPSNALPGDFNGDGLLDTLIVPTTVMATGGHAPATVLFGTGKGLALSRVNVSIPFDATADLRIADVNGDGRDDITSFHACTAVEYSRGDGSFVHTNADCGSSGTVGTGVGRSTSQVGDFNGDGRADMVRIIGAALSVLEQQPASGRDLMTSVGDAGTPWSRETVAYSSSWSDHMERTTFTSCQFPLTCLRSRPTVARSVQDRARVVDPATPALATGNTMYYSFEDPVQAWGGRGSLAFSTMHVWEPARPLETTTTFAHRSAAVVGGHTVYPYVGVPDSVTTVVPVLTPAQSAQLPATATARVEQTSYSPTVKALAGGASYTVYDAHSTTRQWEQPVWVTWPGLGGGVSQLRHVSAADGTPVTAPATPARTVEHWSGLDAYGNVTTDIRTTTGGISQATVTTYDTSAQRVTDWLVSLPTHTTVLNAQPGQAAVARHYDTGYDSLGRVSVATVEKGSADTSLTSATSYAFDSLGLLRTMTQSSAGLPTRATHTEYAPGFPGQPDERIYPSQVWSQGEVAERDPSTWMTIHPAYGVAVGSEDANGVVSSSRYDDLGRLVGTVPPVGDPTSISYANRPEQSGTNGTVATSTTGPVTTTTSTDATGSVVATTTPAFSGGTTTVTTTHDRLGRVTASSSAAPGGTSDYTYDSLDRLRVSTSPNGASTVWSYTFLTAKQIDPSGRTTTSAYDVDGQLVESTRLLLGDRARPTHTLATTYTYSAFGLPHTQTDPAGNSSSSDYDVLGRATHTVDPDRGITDTSYFGSGEIHVRTRPATGNATSYTYDALGRARTATSEDGTTTYAYDTSVHGIGKPGTATSSDGVQTSWRYDGFGRLVGTDYTDPADGAAYSIDQGYDSHGRPDTLTYPAAPGRPRFSVRTGYNAVGQASGLTDVSTGQSLWQVLSRQPNRSLDTAVVGSGAGAITLHATYEPLTAQLHSTTASVGGVTALSLVLGHDVTGLVTSRTRKDAGADRTETYDYDSLQRLTGWHVADSTSGQQQQFDTAYGHDDIGNLTSVSSTEHQENRHFGAPDGSQPHALTGVGNALAVKAQTMGYDPQGRQTLVTSADAKTARSATYSALDLPRTITTAAGVTRMTYDAAGNRFRKTAPNGDVTVSVGGLFEKRVTAGASTYVHTLDGTDGPIGQVVFDGKSSRYEYHVVDNQGSVAAVVDGAGKVGPATFYDPYGRTTASTGKRIDAVPGEVRTGFTGQQMDDELGLVNMGGRIYDPRTATFLSTDPLDHDNPYSYAHNNPVNLTDPSGLVVAGCNSSGICSGDAGGGSAPCSCGWGSGGSDGGFGGGGGEHGGVGGDGGETSDAGSAAAQSAADFFGASDAFHDGGIVGVHGWQQGELSRAGERWDSEVQARIDEISVAARAAVDDNADADVRINGSDAPPPEDPAVTREHYCEEHPSCDDADGIAEAYDWSPNTPGFEDCPMSDPYCSPAFEAVGGQRVKDNTDPGPDRMVKMNGVTMLDATAEALDSLIEAARADGIGGDLLLPASGYRSYNEQAALYAQAVKKHGAAEASNWVAPAGKSAHQSGRAVDVNMGSSADSENVGIQRQTKAYKWMVKHAADFDFYPWQKEPWHWEYNPKAY